jgi:hypothetical protein
MTVHWEHRKWGPQFHKSAAEGSSIRRALSNGLLSFFSDSNSRDRRRDAHAHLRCEIWREKPNSARSRQGRASAAAHAGTARKST